MIKCLFSFFANFLFLLFNWPRLKNSCPRSIFLCFPMVNFLYLLPLQNLQFVWVIKKNKSDGHLDNKIVITVTFLFLFKKGGFLNLNKSNHLFVALICFTLWGVFSNKSKVQRSWSFIFNFIWLLKVIINLRVPARSQLLGQYNLISNLLINTSYWR